MGKKAAKSFQPCVKKWKAYVLCNVIMIMGYERMEGFKVYFLSICSSESDHGFSLFLKIKVPVRIKYFLPHTFVGIDMYAIVFSSLKNNVHVDTYLLEINNIRFMIYLA